MVIASLLVTAIASVGVALPAAAPPATAQTATVPSTTAPSTVVKPHRRFPKAAASYLVAIDDEVKWARKPDTPLLPASLTKIMTALVVLEGDWDPDALVTVSRTAARETGSRLRLRPGEVLRAGDLMTAMLVRSANDACVALAEHAGGSVEAFVARMNERAAELGLASTHYENPCGHDAPGQRSSARDLLRLADEALKHPEFARTVAIREAEIRTERGRRIPLRSGNHLLGSSPGVLGVKTGFTPGAGKCLVAAAERSGTRVTVVLLNSANRWWTAAALLEEAFNAARAAR